MLRRKTSIPIFPFIFMLLFSLRINASRANWKEETALVSISKGVSEVRALKSERVLFSHPDPQIAIEWSLSNFLNTVVLPGKYLIGESIDIPRSGVTLIISKGAEIRLNPETEHKTDIGFRPAGSHHLIPLIYNKCRNNVRIVHLGNLVHSSWPKAKPPKQTFPVVFDGRKADRTCGIQGGFLLAAGAAGQSFLILDSRGVEVPLAILSNPKALDAVIAMEGCESCKLGMIVNLGPKISDQTGETVDLNSSNSNISIEKLIGQRAFEIIDCNASHANVQSLVSIERPRKLLCFTTGSGPRWTSRPRVARRLDVWDARVLEGVTGVEKQIEAPSFPEALPKFSVKATVKVIFEDGRKELFTKQVTVDISRR